MWCFFIFPLPHPYLSLQYDDNMCIFYTYKIQFEGIYTYNTYGYCVYKKICMYIIAIFYMYNIHLKYSDNIIGKLFSDYRSFILFNYR